MRSGKIRVETRRFRGGGVEVTIVGSNGQPVAAIQVERQSTVDTKGTDAYAVTYRNRVNNGLPHERHFQGSTDVVRVPRVPA